jgi:dihydroorotase
MVRRDVELAALTGGRTHLAHLSCAESLDALRDARERGLPVTGETCPHYWTLTEDSVLGYDTLAKMNPPLRAERDRVAVIDAIRDGTIDCLVTDHAPHTGEEKRQPFDQAPFGIVGLETALALTITHLVEPGHIELARALELWTDAPRRVFGLPEVRLEAGYPADLVLIDPAASWTVDPAAFHSKGRNTPFAGARLSGRALATICDSRAPATRPFSRFACLISKMPPTMSMIPGMAASGRTSIHAVGKMAAAIRNQPATRSNVARSRTCPHTRHSRRWTHLPCVFRHSSQPSGVRGCRS